MDTCVTVHLLGRPRGIDLFTAANPEAIGAIARAIIGYRFKVVPIPPRGRDCILMAIDLAPTCKHEVLSAAFGIPVHGHAVIVRKDIAERIPL